MGKMRVKMSSGDQNEYEGEESCTKFYGGESIEKAYGCYWIQLEEQKQSC